MGRRMETRGHELRIVAAVLLHVAALSRAAVYAGERVEYNRDIRPILSANCFPCHGPDEKKRKAKMRLDRKDDALRDRDGYAVIVPGQPDESEVVLRIEADDDTLKMPPPKSRKTLTPAQVERIKAWIAQGAEY